MIDEPEVEAEIQPGDPYESDPIRARQARNVSREAAKWRVQFRAAQARISELETQIAAQPSAGASGGDESEAGAARLAAPVEDDEMQELEVMHRGLLTSALERELADCGAIYPREMRELLEGRQQVVVGDDGSFGLLVDGEALPLSSASLERLARPEFLRAKGVGGTGSRAGAARGMGLDYERGLSDVGYFQKNKTAMLAELRRRQG